MGAAGERRWLRRFDGVPQATSGVERQGQGQAARARAQRQRGVCSRGRVWARGHARGQEGSVARVVAPPLTLLVQRLASSLPLSESRASSSSRSRSSQADPRRLGGPRRCSPHQLRPFPPSHDGPVLTFSRAKPIILPRKDPVVKALIPKESLDKLSFKKKVVLPLPPASAPVPSVAQSARVPSPKGPFSMLETRSVATGALEPREQSSQEHPSVDPRRRPSAGVQPAPPAGPAIPLFLPSSSSSEDEGEALSPEVDLTLALNDLKATQFYANTIEFRTWADPSIACAKVLGISGTEALRLRGFVSLALGCVRANVLDAGSDAASSSTPSCRSKSRASTLRSCSCS